jgi:hypothetical protein
MKCKILKDLTLKDFERLNIYDLPENANPNEIYYLEGEICTVVEETLGNNRTIGVCMPSGEDWWYLYAADVELLPEGA